MPALAKGNWELACLARASGEIMKTAYEAAGFKYNPQSANRFFKRSLIAARVAEIQAERHAMDAKAREVAAEESGVTLAWTEKHYKYIVLGALRGDPVRERDGRIKRDPETGQAIYKPDRYSAVKALDSLTRMKGGFIDRTEIGSPGDFTRHTDDELDKAIIETAKALGLPDSAVKLLTHQPPEDEE